MTRGHVIPACK